RTLSCTGPFHAVEHGGKAAILIIVAGALPEGGSSDAGRAMAAENAAGSVFPLDIVENEILGRDDVTFQPNHFRNVGDAAGTVAQACGLDDDIDRTDDDLAHGLLRQHIAAHGDHGFHAVEAFTRAVGVYRAHRTIVARIHGLQ